MKAISVQSVFLFLFLFVFTNSSNAQSVNFTCAFFPQDLAVRGNELWSANFYGGISYVNLSTGQKMSYTAGNTPLLSNLVDVAFIDKAGNKWFGGRGLYKFDGISWTRYYDLPSGDTLFRVGQIREGLNGKIYALESDYGGFTLLEVNGNSTSIIDLSAIPTQSGGAKDFAIDSLGNFWFTSYNGGVIKYDGNNWTSYTKSNTIFLANDINYIEIDKRGIIWATSSGYQAIYKFNGITWTRIPNVPNAIQASLGKVRVDEQNNKYFYRFHNNVYKYNDTSWTVLTVATGQLPAANLPSLYVANGVLYSGTYGNIVGAFDGTTQKQINIGAYEFESNYFRSVTRSPNNLIAANDFHAIYIFDGISFQKIEIPPSFRSDAEVIRFDAQNNIWLGANRGNYMSTTPSLAKYDGSSWTIYPAFKQDILDLEIQPNGDMLFATSLGAVKIAANQTPACSGPGINYVYSVSVDKKGAIWYGGDTSITRITANSTMQFDHTNSPIDNQIIGFVKADSKGNVWANGTDGILKFTDSTYVLYTTTNSNWSGGSGRNGIRSMCEDPSGNLYFGTGKGIVKFDGVNFKLFSSADYHIGCDYFNDMVIDANQNIWYSGWNVLGLFNPNNPEFGPYELPNKIEGKVYHDVNANGNLDAFDGGIPNAKVFLEPDSIYQVTNFAGDYVFHCDTGLRKVSVSVPYGWHPSNSPVDYSVQVDTTDECCFNFGCAPDSAFQNINLTLINSTTRCNRISPFWLDVYNESSGPEDVQVYCKLDTLVQYISANPTPSIVTGNSLYWNFSQLRPYLHQGISISSKMHNQSFAGDSIHYQASLLSLSTGNVLDETKISKVLTCSLDPNVKSVNPVGVDSAHYTLMTETLEYTIQFQNTGTDTAFSVLLFDTLNSNLDVTTFQFLSASHPVEVKLDRNACLRFTFHHIQLPDSGANQGASNGYVRYSIRAKANLLNNTLVTNKAAIYFDFNLPFSTNLVSNTLVNALPTAVPEYATNANFSLFPNPVNGETITLVINTATTSNQIFDLYDCNGRKVFSKKIPGNTTSFTFALPNLCNGIYMGILINNGMPLQRKIALMR